MNAFCPPNAPVAHTRFVDEVHPAPEKLEDYVAALEEHLAHRGSEYRWVIIGDDLLLSALAERADADWLDGWFPVDRKSSAVRVISSKAAFVAAAAEAGIPIPASRNCATLEEAKAGAREVGYPLILKKAISFSGEGVRAAQNERELEDAYAALSCAEPMVLQKFLGGKIGNSIVLFDRGTPLRWMSAYKVRTFPGPFGPSSARKFMSHPDVEPIVTAVGRLTGYHGFGAVDWILDEATGRLFVIEFNARCVPNIHLGRFAEVDFAGGVREMLSGKPTVQPPVAMPDDAAVIALFPEDFYRAALEKKNGTPPPAPGAREWRFRDIPWNDPPLLAYHARVVVKALLARDGGK